jgi:hypothetical protein
MTIEGEDPDTDIDRFIKNEILFLREQGFETFEEMISDLMNKEMMDTAKAVVLTEIFAQLTKFLLASGIATCEGLVADVETLNDKAESEPRKR